MLCQFTFENFKSYKNETILDMQAVGGQNFQESLIYSSSDKKEFLPVSVIYGPNGGGKSNVLDAINCIVSLVMKPILIFKNNMKYFLFICIEKDFFHLVRKLIDIFVVIDK